MKKIIRLSLLFVSLWFPFSNGLSATVTPYFCLPNSVDEFSGDADSIIAPAIDYATTFYNQRHKTPASFSFNSETYPTFSQVMVYLDKVAPPDPIYPKFSFFTCVRSCIPPNTYDATLPACVRSTPIDPPKNGGPPPPPCNGTNPINGGTGNKYQLETDYRSSGVYPLVFQRHYNSIDTGKSAIGNRWHNSFSDNLLIEAPNPISVPNSIRVNRALGVVYQFYLRNGVWTSESDVNFKLVNLSNGQWQLTREDDAIELYDSYGKLQSIQTRNGFKQTLSYDGVGRLSQVVDSFGQSLSFYYVSSTADANIDHIVLPDNNIIYYIYQTNGNLSDVIYPTTAKRSYYYEDSRFPNALTGITDENRVRFASWTYDTQGRAISSEHAGGVEHVDLTYNTNGTATLTDALGAVRTYNFQPILGVVKSTGLNQPCATCGSGANTIHYDTNGNVNYRIDFNGNRTNYSYDLTRNLETSRTEGLKADGTTTPETRTITTQWDSVFRLPAVVTQADQQTSWQYDTHGNVKQKTITDTVNNKSRVWNTSYSYSTIVAGAILQKVEDGPRLDVNDLTTTDYYTPSEVCVGNHFGCRGQVKQITNALGQITKIPSYNAHSQVTQLIDANGLITNLTYDDRQRLISLNMGGEITRYDYDNAGQLTYVTHPDNSQLAYEYDDAHRLTRIRDSLGNQVVYRLDLLGNRTEEDILDPTNQLTQTLLRDYDTLNHLVGVFNADYGVSYSYDNQGNLKNTYNYSGVTQNGYDALNRLLQSIDPANGITSNTLDTRDNLTSVTDPKNNKTQYVYNGLDDLITEISPDRGTIKYSYDDAGNLKTSTDARGVVSTLTYDALNRPLTKSYTTVVNVPATTQNTWTYDQGVNGIGRLTGVSDETGSTSYSYDLQGRLLTKKQISTVNAVSLTQNLSYAYDAVGHLISQTYPSGVKITYGYDAQGKINTITVNGQTLLKDLIYQPFGLPKSWTWDNGLQLINGQWRNGTSYSRNFDSAGYLNSYPLGTDTRNLIYDGGGRITAYTQNAISNNSSFGYDALDRLIGSSGINNQSYDYDANGNRTDITIGNAFYAYNSDALSNRLTTVAGPVAKSYSYDASGNTLSDSKSSFVWNANGRLSQMTKGTIIYNYQHNALGERISKNGSTLFNGPWRFVYDSAGHLIGEYEKYNQPIQETVWLGDLPIAVIKKDAVTHQPVFYYVHADHLNTPRVILNTNNTVVWRWDSDAFGVGLANQDPDGDGVAFVYNPRFPGQYYDAETGLYYNYQRTYDSALGRYLQSDPIGLAGGLNTYGYVGGNPVGWVDPYGEFGLLGAAIGSGIDLGFQLLSNGGRLSCVNWTDVGLSAVAGALTGGFGDGAFTWKAGSNTWGATRKWLAKNVWNLNKGQEVHHWFIEQRSTIGKMIPDQIKNQPWNLNPMPSLEWHDFLHNIDPVSRTVLGAPGWAQGSLIGSGVAIFGGNGENDCGCN
ncbi:MAG: RHS repeat-associated core domain-containing protein [Methylococcaceae bacterium]